jgi:hypothetical protein
MATVTESTYQEELYQISFPAGIILTKVWADITAKEKEQLQKITDALKQRLSPKLSLDAFQIIYQPKFDLNLIPHPPKRLVYFGPAVNGLSNHELIEVNGIHVVLSESLEELTNNETSRQKLWKALQQLFTK